jgi:hypothetical protein
MIAAIVCLVVGLGILAGYVSYSERKREEAQEQFWRQEQLRLIAEHYARQARKR